VSCWFFGKSHDARLAHPIHNFLTYLAETFESYLLDYILHKDYPPADDKQLLESLVRQKNVGTGEKVLGVAGDRQFDTNALAKALELAGIEDWNCPRAPA
jgi:hypothetical protein